jgi:hypothetical protein
MARAAVHLQRVLSDLDRRPYLAPPVEAALAVVGDLILDLGFRQLTRAQLTPPSPRQVETTRYLGFALAASPFGGELRRAYGALPASSGFLPLAQTAAPGKILREGLDPFFRTTQLIEPDFLVKNAFRREEFLRKWISLFEVPIAGESPAESAKRLGQLDYGRLTATLKAEEQKRKELAKKWEAQRAAREAQRNSYE